jgi:hypothetical protein
MFPNGVASLVITDGMRGGRGERDRVQGSTGKENWIPPYQVRGRLIRSGMTGMGKGASNIFLSFPYFGV